jgi:hypothetical protein
VKQIEVYPVNGLGNRIQAIASGINSAKKMNVSLKIYWTVDDKFPLSSHEIFSKATLKKFHFVDVPVNPYDKNKIGWTEFIENNQLLLKGGRKGEQYFIRPYLRDKLKDRYENLIVVAGGFFDLSSDDFSPSEIRENFSEIAFSDRIVRECKLIQKKIPSAYSVLHLRYHDKTHESAKVSEVINYMKKNSKSSPICILSDDLTKKTEVLKKLQALSLNIFIIDNSNLDRYTIEGLKNSLIEFLLIVDAETVFASAQSTFSHEAIFFNKNTKTDYRLIQSTLSRLTFRNRRNQLGNKYRALLNFIAVCLNKVKILPRKFLKK